MLDSLKSFKAGSFKVFMGLFRVGTMVGNIENYSETTDCMGLQWFNVTDRMMLCFRTHGSFCMYCRVTVRLVLAILPQVHPSIFTPPSSTCKFTLSYSRIAAQDAGP